MRKDQGSRVLMILENCPYRLDGRVTREARTLVEAGYRVTVVCRSYRGWKLHDVVDDVHLYQFPPTKGGGNLAGYLWEYTYAGLAALVLSLLVLLREGFDILHVHNPPDVFFPLAAFYKVLGKKFVYDHHDLGPELYEARTAGRGRTIVRQVLVWSERLSCRTADMVLATNQSYKSTEMQRGHVPEERITIVRNGPDLQELRAGSRPVPRLLRKAMIVYVGVIALQDGVDGLLRALYHLTHDLGRTDILCILVGDGDALPQTKLMAKQLGLTPYVMFTGWVERDDVCGYLRAADICVAPEPPNPFNDRSTMVKVMEYMAAGKPTVAYDLTEHRFTAQGAAAYAKPHDELDFARQIASLMDDPGRRMRMGREGRERIERELAWVHQKRHLLDAYGALGASARSAGGATARGNREAIGKCSIGPGSRLVSDTAPRYAIVRRPCMPAITDYEGSDYRGDYWEGTGREYEDLVERDALARLMPPVGRHLLDIGAGYGRLVPLYGGYEQVILLDYSCSLLEEARERLGDGRFVYVAADLYHMPLAANTVDTAVMVRVLHHLADVPMALREIARVTRPQGCLVLEFANKRHLKNLLRRLAGCGPNPHDLGPYEMGPLYFNFHPAWIAQQLRAVGLEQERSFPVSQLRSRFLKRWLRPGALLALDRLLRDVSAPLLPGPSVFLRARVDKPLSGGPASALFCCPICNHEALNRADAGLRCPQCGACWPIVNGIHVFKQ